MPPSAHQQGDLVMRDVRRYRSRSGNPFFDGTAVSQPYPSPTASPSHSHSRSPSSSSRTSSISPSGSPSRLLAGGGSGGAVMLQALSSASWLQSANSSSTPTPTPLQPPENGAGGPCQMGRRLGASGGSGFSGASYGFSRAPRRHTEASVYDEDPPSSNGGKRNKDSYISNDLVVRSSSAPVLPTREGRRCDPSLQLLEAVAREGSLS